MFGRRKSQRVELAAKVQTQSTGFSFLAAAGDVGEGGMLIFTANPSPLGEEVRLEFTLPGSPETISTGAVVVRVVPGTSMGVRFNDLDPDALAAIRRFVEKAGKSG